MSSFPGARPKVWAKGRRLLVCNSPLPRGPPKPPGEPPRRFSPGGFTPSLGYEIPPVEFPSPPKGRWPGALPRILFFRQNPPPRTGEPLGFSRRGCRRVTGSSALHLREPLPTPPNEDGLAAAPLFELWGEFAEFLQYDSSIRLCIFCSPTGVGSRYGRAGGHRRFFLFSGRFLLRARDTCRSDSRPKGFGAPG